MMHSFIFYASLLSLLPVLTQALPHGLPGTEVLSTGKRSFELPLQRRKILRSGAGALQKRGSDSGTTGLGDFLDLFYSVPITVGGTNTAVNIDTGSSDLWIVSDACQTTTCKSSNQPAYPATGMNTTGASVNLQYGDSLTGTHASGPIAVDSAMVAGISMPQQVFAAISDTNNTSVMNGTNGIFGLGFPSGSQIQAAVVNKNFNTPPTTDDFVLNTASDGPLLSRLALTSQLEQPMFSIMLQRDEIDVGGGNGALTIGKLPDGVDNSSLTWVPVRLYTAKQGGLYPPTFAPNEVYPLRWEVPIDSVTLDGTQLPVSTLGGGPGTVTALLDTGNSLIRGPQDVVNSALAKVSTAYAANSKSPPTYPCATPHELSFQIGGQPFPIDPRDFLVQNQSGDARTCVANNLVSTDPPSNGALFSWSLGDPFFKSNLVAFYYGNLTHPSVDPPRIGFKSMVPANASTLLQNDVQAAVSSNGVFSSTSQAAPTTTIASTISVAPTTLSAPPSTTSDVRTSKHSSSAPRIGTQTAFATASFSALIWIVFASL